MCVCVRVGLLSCLMVCIGDRGDGAPPDFFFLFNLSPPHSALWCFEAQVKDHSIKTDESSGPVLQLNISSIYFVVPIKKLNLKQKLIPIQNFRIKIQQNSYDYHPYMVYLRTTAHVEEIPPFHPLPALTACTPTPHRHTQQRQCRGG